jgi:polyhydroxyalkanoate synthesis regulator phasin
MNSDNFTKLLQQGFRIAVGATASLVENLQDSQKRTEKLSQIKSEIDQLATQWANKGEMTEQEARNFAQQMLNQLRNQQSNPTSQSYPDAAVGKTADVAPPDLQLEVQELTAQIAAMRVELEKLQNPDS